MDNAGMIATVRHLDLSATRWHNANYQSAAHFMGHKGAK